MIYAEVIVPLPLKGTFTYIVPPQYTNQVTEGSRVIVQFGKKKFYTAIVHSVYDTDEVKNDIKEITTLLDDKPIVLPQQLRFWEWISSYYMCTLGEVYKAALPSALKLESETMVYLNPTFENWEALNNSENALIEFLDSKKGLLVSEIEKKSKLKNIITHIKSLNDKGALLLSEDVQKKYSEKTESAIRFNKDLSEEQLHNALNDVRRAKKQYELLSFFTQIRSKSSNKEEFFITKKDLSQKSGISTSIIDALVDKNIFDSFLIVNSRIATNRESLNNISELSAKQEEAYNQVKEQFEEKDTVLLHGVTASGKTEIYIKLIDEHIKQGKQVLYLLPEIGLTTQITERLRSVFGDSLLVYHSKFNDNERAETWQELLKNHKSRVVVGARSSIFLPFTNLGLIIVDEEHESSYKQQDPTPRYNAKNSAIVLASLHNSRTLLGSATPSIEAYYNSTTGRFGLVELKTRFKEVLLPNIKSINTKELRRTKQMKTILSPPLTKKIEETLENNEQVILFQNRRGFAPMVECKTCSWTPRCQNCDVSLTYHKGQRILSCHYCAAVYSIPTECPECKTQTLDNLGYGTERIEELVAETIPQANTVRMDLDTTRTKRAFENIINDFQNNKTNVLIGTQMISKGLDFENVSLVGILNADNMLNYPDFRAHEKAFQLITQVSGRAGRRSKQGNVYIQTAHPQHPIISYIKNNDYKSFYDLQTDERRIFKYPPFFRIIEVVLRSKDERLLIDASDALARSLKQTFNDRVLGPTRPPVSRVQSLYIRKIILKIENQASPQKIREFLEIHQNMVLNNASYKAILVHYDVDPM